MHLYPYFIGSKTNARKLLPAVVQKVKFSIKTRTQDYPLWVVFVELSHLKLKFAGFFGL